MGLQDYKDKVIWRTILMLVDEAKRIIEKARSNRPAVSGRKPAIEDRSGTQYDSYGAAVFYNGALRYTLKSVAPGTTTTRMTRFIETAFNEENGRHKGYKDIPAGTGREWVKMYVDDLKKRNEIPKTGFALVIFNAAFYSGVQEHGAAGHYRILSQVITDLENVGRKFKSKEKIIPLNLPGI